MVALMLPAGHFVGEFYTAPGSESPDFYQVRLGRDIFQLDSGTYAVWALAHGDPEALAGGAEGSRLAIAVAARESGMTDVAPQLAELQELGLLVQVLPVDAQRRRFAEAHHLVPLALGLGNSADNIGQMNIGHPEQIRLSLSALAYSVWALGDSGSLWDTCGQVATQLDGQSSPPLTQAAVLKEFFDALPTLIALSCAYLDRR